MIRLGMPHSLKGRLLLLLIGGLIAAQVVAAVIAYYDRKASIERVVARRNAVRVADLVRMLDGLQPGDRERAVAALRYPVIRLGPLALPRADNMPEQSIGAETRSGLIAEELIDAFRDRLNPPRDVDVRLGETQPRYSPDAGSMVPKALTTGRRDSVWGVSVRSTLGDNTPVLVYVEVPHAFVFSISSMVWQFVVLSAVTILLVALVVEWVMRPLRELADAAERLGDDLDAPPLSERGASELRRAARAFNSMQERLTRYLKSRVTALTAISHDLKTPITRMRLRAELIEDGPLRDSFLRDMSELEAMVRSALEFIRGLDSSEPPQPTDINALIESVCEDYREAGHEVVTEGAANAPFPAQTQALKHCLANIIDNACKYGGKAQIVVQDGEQQMVIKVRDFGHGVPDSELEKVFEPFYRLENSRSRDTGGSGLGLAIARNVAQLHHGWVSIRNHPEGGLEATLALPRL
jgi:signal transduction histidine kinase